MTNINPNAAAAREAARAGSGQFGEQNRPPADVVLGEEGAPKATIDIVGDGSGELYDTFRAGLVGATAVVRSEYPTAHEIELEDVNDEGGSPYWWAMKVRDRDGNVLWERPDSGYDDLSDALDEHTPSLDRLGYDAVDLTPDVSAHDAGKHYGVRLPEHARETKPVHTRLNFTSSLEEAVDWDGKGAAPHQMSESTQRYTVWGEINPGTWAPAYRGDDAAQAQKVANEHDERMNVKFFDTSSSTPR
ncbi:hypothetical protein ACWGJ9_10970 [Curtobacterium citreum]